jgi:malonyl-CoA decarboxylase
MNATTSWIADRVSRLLPNPVGKAAPKGDPAPPQKQPAADGGALHAVPLSRSTGDRLQGRLKKKDEGLSPRQLRHLLEDLRAVVDTHISEIEGGLRALKLAQWYGAAAAAPRRDMWLLMSEQFVADPQVVKRAQARYAAAVGTLDEAAAEVIYRRSTVSPRRRLLQRFSAFPAGIRFLVDMRAEMAPALKSDRRLQALDVEMEYMFSTWFDVGFLELRRISWDSPASLIEKLIKYEAVHDIKSWADVKNRLDSDRRCYGFFHPRLPDEPLIFVEVALLDELAACITPLLDEQASASDLNKATTAIFYSISNTQAGLRGVSFGDSLIKRVVEALKQEFAGLKVFSTLSPIPGFRAWFLKNAEMLLQKLPEKDRAHLPGAAGSAAVGEGLIRAVLEAADKPLGLEAESEMARFLVRCAGQYLGREMQEGKPLDPVARFHLGNGARVERINWAGDPSTKGLKQSCGLMVNYLYDLKRLDKNRTQLEQGKIAVSKTIDNLKF